MIKDIPFDKMIRTAMRHGAEYADVFFEDTKRTSIICDNKKLERVGESSEKGISIRVMTDGRVFLSSTTDLSRRNLLRLAKEVALAAKTKRKKAPPFELKAPRTKTIGTVRRHPFGIPLAEKCSAVVAADKMAWGISPVIKQARILYRDTVRRISIASSNGTIVDDEQIDIVFTVLAMAANGRTTQTGYEAIGGMTGFELFDDNPPEVVAEQAASRAVKLLDARPAPAGRMTVVISAEAGGTMIHEAVGHGLEADLAGEGMSVYSGKLGQKVASPIVSVVDDATLKGQRGSFTFDDEGTPAQKTVLIENGILKTYLTSVQTARRTNLPLSGNARRASFEDEPIVRMTNTLILPGKHDPAAILKDTQNGLFVKKMGGGQVNTINGDFVFDVQEGYLIKNGEANELVRGATLIGNGPKILENIDRVGNDLGFSIGTCGKNGQEAPVSCGQPTIRIPEIVVGGTG